MILNPLGIKIKNKKNNKKTIIKTVEVSSFTVIQGPSTVPRMKVLRKVLELKVSRKVINSS